MKIKDFNYDNKIEGLSMMLIVNKPQNTELASGLGITLKVHDQDELAFTQVDGLPLEAGYITNIAITVVSNFQNK